MPTIADYRNKFPSLRALDDAALIDRVAEVQGVARDDVIAHMGWKPKPAGLLRSVADLGIEAASGVARGVKATADAFGADNAVSQGADAVDKFARDYLSASAKADDRRVSDIMAAAQDAGVWEQVKAAAEAFTVKPGGFIMNSLGTSVPTIATALIPGVGQAGVAARLGALGAMGAAQGAGAVKGSIYEAVKAEQIKAGASEADAEAAAVRAQEYGGENTANIAGGAALGGAASATGVQPVIAKMLQRGAEPVVQAGQRGMLQRALNPEGLLARTGMGALKEAPLEAAQGGQEQYASNIALQNEGFDAPAFRGVAGAAALEGLASAGPGAAFAAISKPAVRGEEAPKPDPVVSVLAAPSVDDAIVAMRDALGAPAVKPRQANAGAAAELAQLDPADRAEALSLMQVSERQDVSGNVRRYAQNRLDELLAPVRQIPAGEAIDALPVAGATELTDAERAEYANAVPMTYRRAMERGLPQPEVAEAIPAGEALDLEPIEAGEATELDVETIQPGDLTTGDGVPYGSKTAANVRAVKEGGTPADVVEIPGAGWVVRLKNAQADVAVDAGRLREFDPNQGPSGLAARVSAQRLRTEQPDGTPLKRAMQRGAAQSVIQPPKGPNDYQRDVAGAAAVAAGPADGASNQPGRSGGTVGRVADDGRAGQVDAGLPTVAAGSNADQAAGPAGGDAGTALTPGTRVTLAGTPYTVTAANNTAVKLQGADGGIKMVAKGSKTYGQIQPEAAPADSATFADSIKAEIEKREADAAAKAARKKPQQKPAAATAEPEDAPYSPKPDGRGGFVLENADEDVIGAPGGGGARTFKSERDALAWAAGNGVPVAQSKEPNEAARPQAQAAAGESAAPAAAPAPTAPAVVPGATSTNVEGGRLKPAEIAALRKKWPGLAGKPVADLLAQERWDKAQRRVREATGYRGDLVGEIQQQVLAEFGGDAALMRDKTGDTARRFNAEWAIRLEAEADRMEAEANTPGTLPNARRNREDNQRREETAKAVQKATAQDIEFNLARVREMVRQGRISPADAERLKGLAESSTDAFDAAMKLEGFVAEKQVPSDTLPVGRAGEAANSPAPVEAGSGSAAPTNAEAPASTQAPAQAGAPVAPAPSEPGVSTAEQVATAQELLAGVQDGEHVSDEDRKAAEQALGIYSLNALADHELRRMLSVLEVNKADTAKVMAMSPRPRSINDIADALGALAGAAAKKSEYERAFKRAAELAPTNERVANALNVYTVEKLQLESIAKERGLYGVKWAERNVGQRWTTQSIKVRKAKDRVVDAVRAAPAATLTPKAQAVKDALARKGEKPAEPPKRTEARGTAKHPRTVMGSRILAIVSQSLGGLDPAWIAEFSHRQEIKATGKDGRPRIEWRNPLIPGVGRLFRRGGTQDLQLLAETMEEAGYLPPGSVEADNKEAGETAKQIVRDALNRTEAQTQDEQQAERQAAEDYERIAYYAELDAESAAEAEAERQAIMASNDIEPARMDATADDDIPFDGPGLSGAAGMRASGMFSEQEIADAEQQERQALQQSRTGGQARQDGSQGARPAAEVGGAAAQPATQEGLKRPPVAEGDRIRFTSKDGATIEGMAVQVLDTSGGNYRIKIRTDEPAPQGGGNISRTVYSQDGTFAPLDEPLLTVQTPADLKAKAEREEAAVKAERAKKTAEQDRLRKEAESRDLKARADQTVDDFQLGQDAEQQMSGMGDLFADAPAPAPAEDPRELGAKAARDGKPRMPPDAMGNFDRQAWRAGWDQAKKTPGPTPQLPTDRQMATFIGIAADSVAKLRASDVDRVIRETPTIYRIAVAGHIKAKRPDLADEVAESLADLGATPAGPKPITPAEAGNMQRGDIVRDGSGTEFYAWSARFGRIDVMPLKDGKPVVNNASAIRFALDDTTRAANPEYRTDPLYLVRSAAPADPATEAAAILNAAAEPPKGAERLSVLKDVKAGAITPEEVAAAFPPAEPGEGLTDADRVPEPVNPVEADAALWKKVTAGEATPDEFKAGFDAWVTNKPAILADLSTKTKADLLKMGGAWFASRYKGDTKPEIAEALWRDGASAYTLGRSFQYGMGKDSYTNGIRKMVEATDADQLAQYVADRKAAQEEALARVAKVAEAIKDPKTLADYQTWMRATMEGGKTFKEARMMLTPEQRAAYDDLAAESTRSSRKVKQDTDRTTVRAAGQTTAGEIIATKHTRDGHDLWVVKLSDRVSKDDYTTLLAGAKRLGGNYSSFRGNGAVPGFQFRTPDAAQAFLKLAGGDTTAATEAAKERRNAFEDDRSQSAAERLTEMADRLEERADENMGRDRKANTDRRARFAASAEAAARADKAMAKTMRNIAGAITNGGAKFLDRVRQKVQVELLQGYIRTAQYEELRAKFTTYAEQQRNEGSPPTFETADYAEFPTFTAYRSDLASLGRQLLEVDGTKLMGQRIMKVADDVSDAYADFAKSPVELAKIILTKRGGDGGYASFSTQSAAEAAIARSGFKGRAISIQYKRGVHHVVLSPSEAIARGIWKGDGDKRITLDPDFAAELVEKIGRASRRGAKVSVPWQFESAYDRRKQLARMGIETPAEFRAALREFIAMREQPAEADKIKAMERAMVGRRNDGLDFFPTPESVADEMVAAADIQPGMRVLEPSAGMGHIAERIRATEVDPDVAEFSADRRELLEAKGFNVVAQDFMALTEGGYDRILMNPPFSDGRDIQHVRHAYDLLKPGGRLVAIMGESAFFNQNKRATEFREWLESVGGTDEKLPEGTFNDPNLPVNTGANARMVVIEKPAGEQAGDGAAKFSRAPGANVDLDKDNDQSTAPAFNSGTMLSDAGLDAVRGSDGEGVSWGGGLRDRGRRNAEAAFSGGEFEGAAAQRGLGQGVRDRPGRLSARPGVPMADAEAVADAIRAAYPTGPQIVMLDDVRKAPEQLLEQIRNAQASNTVEGAYWKGKIYLFPQNVADIQRLMFVGAHHEIRHAGLDALFGKRKGALLLGIAMSNPKVSAAAKQKMADGLADSMIAGTEEALADMPIEDMAKLNGWSKIVAAVRQWLRGMADKLQRNHPKLATMIRPDEWTGNDVAALIRRAEDISRGGTVPARPGGAVFSRADPTQAPANGEPARFSRTAGAAKTTAQDLVNATGGVFDFNRLGETKQDRLRTIMDASRPGWLGLLTRDQIADVYGKEIPPVKEYDELTRAMENQRSKIAQDADDLYTEWAKLPAETNDKLARLMLDATIYSVHPDAAFSKLDKGNDAERQQVHARLKAQYALMGKEGQAIYAKVRDFHKGTLTQLRDALEARVKRQVENGAAKAAALTKIRQAFDAYLKEGPYFPLSRFGDFIVVGTRAADGERVVASYATAGEQAAAARTLEADGFTVKMKTAKTYSRETDGSAGKFIGDVLTTLSNLDMADATVGGNVADLKTKLMDDVNQLFIKALPDLSYRKHFMHRKGTPGFSSDMMRGFASSAFHAASHIARLNHGDRMTFALQDAFTAIEQAPEGDFNLHSQVLNELTKRHDAALNPNTHPVAAMLNQVGFVMYLGLSPAAGIINMLQTVMVTMPHLGARYGFGKANASLAAALADITTGAKANAKNGWNAAQSTKLTGAERTMMSELQDEGVIDLTQAHDLSAATGLDTGNVARSKAAFAMARAMKIVGWTFHIPEVMNRQVTALSAYRLEMQKSGNAEKAKDAAREAIKRTHFDYSSSNRARFMQGNVARVLLQFKQYSQNMTYLLGRAAHQALKGESPEVRSIARRQLVATFAVTWGMAGALGLPGLGTVAGLIGMLVGAMDDDDEPWDWKVEFRNLMADTFGKEAGEVLSHGIPRALMPWDISNRVSLGDLWFRDSGREGQSPREAFATDAANILGPTAGTVLGLYTAADHMARGNWSKAAESVVPKFLRDPLKAIREGSDGVTSYNGEPLMDVTGAEVAGRLLGFAPARASEMYEGKAAVMNAKTAIEDKRQSLISRMAKARIEKDADTAAELQPEIAAFNQRNPEFRITGATLAKAIMTRMKNRQNTEAGILLPRTKDSLRDIGRFAEVD